MAEQTAQPVVQWHPASEPPDNDRAILILEPDEYRGHYCYGVGWYENGHWYDRDTGFDHPSHWCELPALPSDSIPFDQEAP